MASRSDLPFIFSSNSPGGDTASVSDSASCGNFEVYNGEIAELAPHADIIKSLECPVCRDIALTPIYQCENGHIVCKTCRKRLLACALCKVPFSNIRNYALESIVAKSKLFCHYKEYGCLEVLVGETLKDHVRACPFKRLERDQPHRSSSIISSVLYGEFQLHLDFRTDSSFGSSWSVTDDDAQSYTQTMVWRRARNGIIPENAVVGGANAQGSPIHVCRAFHQHICAPGMICSSDRVAYLNWFGTKSKYYYEVLVAVPHTFRWVPCRGGNIPENAVIGADQRSEGFEYLYVGRAKIDNHWVTGYVKASHRRCYVSNGRTALGRKYYQILVSC